MRCPANGYLNVQLSNAVAEGTYRAQKFQIAGLEFEETAV